MPDEEQQTQHEVPADDAGFDRDALESSVSAKMSDVFKDDDDTLTESEPAASAKTEPEPEPAKEESKTETEQEVKEPAASDQEKPTVTASPASTLPAAYRRSLKAYQWTDAEIDAALKQNPEGFLKTAEKMHVTRVQETQRWADMGRAARTQTTPTKTAETAPKFDAKALRDKYGDEPFITQMEIQAQQIEQAQAFINQSRERQQAAEMEQLGKQIDGFFSSKDLAPYHDHYGKAGNTLTDKQLAARQQVLETADLLVSGARSTGRSLTLDDALTMAHDSVSSPVREQVAIAKVKTQVSQRQASITQRPGSRAATQPAATRKNLEQVVKSKLASVFS